MQAPSWGSRFLSFPLGPSQPKSPVQPGSSTPSAAQRAAPHGAHGRGRQLAVLAVRFVSKCSAPKQSDSDFRMNLVENWGLGGRGGGRGGRNSSKVPGSSSKQVGFGCFHPPGDYLGATQTSGDQPLFLSQPRRHRLPNGQRSRKRLLRLHQAPAPALKNLQGLSERNGGH